MQESATITIQNNTAKPITQVMARNIASEVLTYDQKHYKGNKNKTTTIKQITANQQKLAYEFKGDESNILVDLPTSLTPGASTQINVEVQTDVPWRKDRFGYQAIAGVKIYNLSFCFPYLSDYRNGKWNYHPYNDEGENRNLAVSDYQAEIYAPKSYKVVTSGESHTKDGKTTVVAKDIRDFVIVASNKFKVSSTKVNGIKINNNYYAGKSAKIYNQLAKQTAVDSIKLFTKKYGPYPYFELDLTESPFGSDTGGMEYSGLVMIAQDTFARKKAASKEDYDSVIEDVSHEVAHQWFFNTVGNDEYTEPWLDEGMAEFSEDIIFDLSPTKTSALYQKLMKTKQDASLMRDVKKMLNQQMKTAIKYKQGKIINYPLNKIPKKYDEADTAYNGGKSFYSLLRYLMGEKKFDQAMRDYYQTYYLKQSTGKDFIAIIKKHDNSKAVNDLIKRYISPKYLQ